MFIDFAWENHQLHMAMILAKKLQALNGSITGGAGSLAGTLGEVMAHVYLPGSELKSTKDYDLIYKGFTIDVKTKRTTMNFVKPNYEASIANWNPSQKCDFYLFARVNMALHKGWFLGFLAPDEYYEKAKFLKKGDVDPSNNFTVKADCWNVPYSEMRPTEWLKEI